jgi:RimJ/RimL family protein N-acetyltransferase
MTPRFRRFEREHDEAALFDLLCNEPWPHRPKPKLTPDDVRNELALGIYTNDNVLTFLIYIGDEVAGYVRADDLGHKREFPQLDFRLRERFRGQGIGPAALDFITREIFDRYPETRRIEGETRSDNAAMRKVFARGGYVMEAVYRQSWPGAEGFHDSIGYAILRGDWETGTTTPVDFSDVG